MVVFLQLIEQAKPGPSPPATAGRLLGDLELGSAADTAPSCEGCKTTAVSKAGRRAAKTACECSPMRRQCLSMRRERATFSPISVAAGVLSRILALHSESKVSALRSPTMKRREM